MKIVKIFMVFSVLLSYSLSQGLTTVDKIKVEPKDNMLSVTISKVKEYKDYRAIRPARLIFDILNAELKTYKKKISVNKGEIKNIYIDKRKNKVVRITIELKKMIPHSVIKIGDTLVVQIESKGIKPALPIERKPVIKPKEEKPDMSKNADDAINKIQPLDEKEPDISSKKEETKPEEKEAKPEENTEIEEKEVENKESETEPEVEAEANEDVNPLDQLVSFNFQNQDLIGILMMISDEIGYNFIPTKSVSGKITMKLNNIPLRKALELILTQAGFTYDIDEKNKILKIGTGTEFVNEEEQGRVVTRVFKLNFASASNLQTAIQSIISSKGKVQIDSRTNQLIVKDTLVKLKEVELMIKRLDSKTKQVEIQAAIIAVSRGKTNEFGINWSLSKGSISGTTPSSTSPDVDTEIKSNPSLQTNGVGSIKIGTITNGLSIGALISAFRQSSKAKVLATPNIVTLDNKTAKINITNNIPYVTGVTIDQNTGTALYTYDNVQTGVSLEVTPQISPDGYVVMKIKPSVVSVAGVGSPPPTDSRDVETEVIVKDGQTLAIGGLLREDETVTTTEVPLIAKIPIIGNLFKSEYKQKTQNELMIFITPRIIAVK